MKVNQVIGLALIAVGVFFAAFAPEIGSFTICFAGVLLLFKVVKVAIAEDEPTEFPLLFRYEVARYGESEVVTVYAARADTDELDAQTVHFTDHNDNTVAIYSHVSRVVARKVVSDED